MILPCASRWTISIGWMTRQRTRTTSPAFTLDGTRMRILPTSLISPPATADGDLHLALRHQQRAVALLDDGAHVGRLAEADVGADERLAGLWREGRPRDDGNAILVGDDPDVLDVGGRRHRRVDLEADRPHGAVLGDGRKLELDQRRAVLHRAPAEDALEAVLHGFLKPERRGLGLGPRATRRGQRPRRDGHADRAERAERRATRHCLCHVRPPDPSTSTTTPRARLRLQPEGRGVGLERSRHPETPAQLAGARRGPGQPAPLPTTPLRLAGIHPAAPLTAAPGGAR